MPSQPNPYQSPDGQSPFGADAAPPDYRDQTVWLIVFGIFQILIGCFCWLMSPLTLVCAVPQPGMPPGTTPEVRMMIPAVIFYFALGVAFISLGIGSIRCRRWARTLIVLLSWVWLIAGVAGTVGLVFLLPKTLAAMQQTAKIPPPGLWWC